MSQHPEIQDENIPMVSLANGTIKRVRMALQKTTYANITSSELIHIIRTPYLEDLEVAQLLPRTLINTWTQGEEEDESGTGNGMMYLNDYKFKFRLIGQLKVAEYICRPQKQGQ